MVYKLDGYRRTGLFGSGGLNIDELLKAGRCSVFLLRDVRNEDKALITAIIARQLSAVMGEHHKRLKVSRFFGKHEEVVSRPEKVWLFIDEAHVVAPSGSSSPATEALIDYVKRGRDAGLSLVMATQHPPSSEPSLSAMHQPRGKKSETRGRVARTCLRPPKLGSSAATLSRCTT